MNDKNWKSLRVDEDTHRRIKLLAIEADLRIDDFVNLIASEYERSRAISRGFGRTPLPMPITEVSP